jgi:hypothetical protein
MRAESVEVHAFDEPAPMPCSAPYTTEALDQMVRPLLSDTDTDVDEAALGPVHYSCKA